MTDGVFLRIIEVIVPVFGIVVLGMIYGRHAQPDLSGFNKISIDVLTPLVVYTALAAKDFNLRDHLPLLTGATLLIFGCGALAWVLAKLAKVDPRSLVPVVMFNNCGNMGLPLALLAFGTGGFNSAVAIFAVNNLLHFSLGMRITSSDSRTRDLLLSPPMIAAVMGVLSGSLDFRPPDLIFTTMRMLGEASLPLMLFALGLRLNFLRTSDLLHGMLGAIARPIFGISLAWSISILLDLKGMSRSQLILFGALPPPVMQYMIAERYSQEPHKVAAMVLAGNAMAVIFVPLALFLAV